MSTHLPGFRSFFIFLRDFVLANLATSSIGVKEQLVKKTKACMCQLKKCILGLSLITPVSMNRQKNLIDYRYRRRHNISIHMQIS